VGQVFRRRLHGDGRPRSRPDGNAGFPTDDVGRPDWGCISDVKLAGHIDGLDLASRYGVKTRAPQVEDWGLVAGVTDPSGVLWRINEALPPQPK
jgi:hypothetical protein